MPIQRGIIESAVHRGQPAIAVWFGEGIETKKIATIHEALGINPGECVDSVMEDGGVKYHVILDSDSSATFIDIAERMRRNIQDKLSFTMIVKRATSLH